MLFLLQFLLIIFAAGIVIFLDRARQKTNLTFIVMMITVSLSWILLFFIRFSLPYELILVDWNLISDAITINLNATNSTWIVGVVFQTIIVFTVASYPARETYFKSIKAIEILFLSLIGIFVIFAGNLLTYIFAWAVLLLVMIFRKFRMQNDTYSWLLIGIFLIWGISWFGVLATNQMLVSWDVLESISSFVLIFYMLLSIVFSLFSFFKASNFSVDCIIFRILILFFMLKPLTHFNNSSLSNGLLFGAKAFLLLLLFLVSVRIIFVAEKEKFYHFSFVLVQGLSIFMMIIGRADFISYLILIWIPAIAFFAINKIEINFVYSIRWTLLLLAFCFPFFYGNSIFLIKESPIVTIFFTIIYVLMIIALMRIANGKNDAFYIKNPWLEISFEEGSWYTVDRWAKTVHWFGAIFLLGSVVSLAIVLGPESLLDVGFALPWQFLLGIVVFVGSMSIWRFKRNWLKLFEKLGKLALSDLNELPIDVKSIRRIVRIVELPEEILESPSGVFWTLLLILFIVSLVM